LGLGQKFSAVRRIFGRIFGVGITEDNRSRRYDNRR
jgi:hypothetical protein